MKTGASRIGSTLFVNLLWLSTLLLSDKVEAQGPGNRVYACSLDQTGLDGTVAAERSAMTDLDAPVLHSAWFAPNGSIVGVDRTAKRVMVLDTDLNLVRDIERHGPGPGEYADPMAAVMDGNGRILATGARCLQSINRGIGRVAASDPRMVR